MNKYETATYSCGICKKAFVGIQEDQIGDAVCLNCKMYICWHCTGTDDKISKCPLCNSKISLLFMDNPKADEIFFSEIIKVKS